MSRKIRKGGEVGCSKVVIYGEAGIGKTTLASQFPRPLFLDTEDGTRKLKGLHAMPCHSWTDFQGDVLSLARDLTYNGQADEPYQTIVIDSADWCEKLLANFITQENGKQSIEDFGFGKGYIMVAERFQKMLDACDDIVRAGAHVVFVAHSKIVRNSPPDQIDGFDRYELKLTKQTAPVLKEWADALLFCHFKTRVIQGSDGRAKATGGKVRVIHSERSAAWDAKNRFGLDEELPLDIEALEAITEVPGGVFKTPPPPTASLVAATLDRINQASTAEVLEKLRPKIEAKKMAGEIEGGEAETLLNSINIRLKEMETAF